MLGAALRRPLSSWVGLKCCGPPGTFRVEVLPSMLQDSGFVADCCVIHPSSLLFSAKAFSTMTAVTRFIITKTATCETAKCHTTCKTGCCSKLHDRIMPCAIIPCRFGPSKTVSIASRSSSDSFIVCGAPLRTIMVYHLIFYHGSSCPNTLRHSFALFLNLERLGASRFRV